MINPLIPNTTKMTNEQIDEKLADLRQKYFMSRNPSVRQQIAAFIDDFSMILQERKIMEKNNKKDDEDDLGLDKLVNIR